MKIPSDAKDIKTIREFLNTVRSQVCSMADYLAEPWKTHFSELKNQYDEALKALPPTDQVPAALEASHHLSAFFSCLASANALVSMLGSAMDSMVKKTDAAVATALNSAVGVELDKRIKAGELVAKVDIDGLVSKGIEDRTKTGELVAKDTVTQLCSEAKNVGIGEGEKKVREEIAAGEVRKKTIGERKTALQTCGLPIPDEKLESILAGTDDEFKAAQKTAEERIAALQKKGVALNAKSPLALKVWLSKEQWEVFESLAVETIKGGDPLVGTGSPATNAGPMGPMVC